MEDVHAQLYSRIYKRPGSYWLGEHPSAVGQYQNNGRCPCTANTSAWLPFLDRTWGRCSKSVAAPHDPKVGYPLVGIVWMVIVVVQYRHRHLFKVIDAAVVVFEPDKSVIVAEQFFQFVRSAASAAVRVFAVLRISVITGVINSHRERFWGSYIIIHRDLPPFLKNRCIVSSPFG